MALERIKRWAIVRRSMHGSYYLLSGPHSKLGARMRITNSRVETVVPWEGNEAGTLDAHVARTVMAGLPDAAFPQSWERWR